MRNRIRIALVTAVVTIVAVATVQQGQIEAAAFAQYQQADSALAAELTGATEIGLTHDEIAPFEESLRALRSGAPPFTVFFFNRPRIGFFEQHRATSSRRAEELRELEGSITARTREEAAATVKALEDRYTRAAALGADPQDLAPFEPAVKQARTSLAQAALPKDFRPLKARALESSTQLDAIVEAQQADNTRVAQLTAEATAQNQGDLALARKNGDGALEDARFDLMMADLMKIDLGRLRWRVDQAADQLQKAQTLAQVEAATGALRYRDALILQTLGTRAPEKAITISLSEQRLRAFEHGKLVWWAYVTTGRPGLETDVGSHQVLRKDSPWTMHSPWPKELPDGRANPWWYPDTPVRWVMWFTNTGEGIHDASWRSVFGPGTNFPHGDVDPGAPNGTHGCVNLPAWRMAWLWDWTPYGTPVIVY